MNEKHPSSHFIKKGGINASFGKLRKDEEISKTLIMTIGLPRSGKSSWARSQNYPIVNPDSIRLALHGKPFDPESEPAVWFIALKMVQSLFLAGHNNVILDATNLTKDRRLFWEKPEWNIRFHYIDTSKEICIERAKKANKDYLIPVIEEMDQTKELEDII